MTENNFEELENKEKKSRRHPLTATQKMVIDEIVSMGITGKTLEDIAKEYKVDRTTIWRWRQKKEFNEELNRVADELQQSKKVVIYQHLDKLLNSKNEKTVLQALEILSRQLGLYKQEIQNNVTVEKKVTIDDIMKAVDDM